VLRAAVTYFAVPGALGEVVDELPVVPVEPPLPTVPAELPPTPVLPVLLEPALPAPVPPALLPVLELPRSCRHLSFIDWSVSCSHFARAAALSAEPDVTSEDDDPVVALGLVVDEPVALGLVVDGELALPDVLPVVPEVWAAAIELAARNAAATAA
jgi:hypothetical protein